MKKLFLLSVIALFGTLNLTFAQKTPASKVPAAIVERFQQDFPAAEDIEWKMKGDFYEVEFEVGRPDKDHTIRYDVNASVLRHKAEISKRDLPDEIIRFLDTEYNSFRIKDAKRIIDGTTTIYTLEAKSPIDEWEMVFDAEGKLLSKVPD